MREKNSQIQILRAIAIIAVVMIHTCPGGYRQILFRPFINFAVATFFFLSGYLTHTKYDSWIQFYKKRIAKLIIPYIIWSVIYSTYNGETDRLLFNLATTQAASPLYYIFVYIQFALLTPLIAKLLTSKIRWIGWMISPVAILLAVYLPMISGKPYSDTFTLIWEISFPGWFIFYYLGMAVGNDIVSFKADTSKLILLYCFAILLQMAEGFMWYKAGYFTCGTQLKLSAIFTSIVFTLLATNFICSNKYAIRSKFLFYIGNISFGIYLLHILIRDLLASAPIYNSLPFVINSVVVVAATILFVWILNKILGKRLSKWFGV